jgi:hypothetical protein
LLREAVERFLKNPELPIWVPPDHVPSNAREFLLGLRIPTYRNGNPSLLFHDLDNLDAFDGQEMDKLFGRDTALYVVYYVLGTFFITTAGVFVTRLDLVKPDA